MNSQTCCMIWPDCFLSLSHCARRYNGIERNSESFRIVYPPPSKAIVVKVKHLPSAIRSEQINLEPNRHKLLEKRHYHHPPYPASMNTMAIIGVTGSLGQPVAKPPHLRPCFAQCGGQKQITITAGPPVVWDSRSKLVESMTRLRLTDTHRNFVALFH